MSNIDKPALREEFKMMQECYSDPADRDRQVIYLAAEALLDELEAKDKRIAELESDCWTYENTVKNLLERAGSAESACLEAASIIESGERMALTRSVEILRAAAGKGE